MNLLAKRLGQLAVLAVALFFFSCEDPTSLGFENPQKKYNINYVDLPLESSVFLLDSLITDHRGTDPTGNIQVGKYSDPLLGVVRAQPFLKFYRTHTGKLADTLVFDSVTVRFRLNLYSYGFDGEVNHKFTIHEITPDTMGTYRRHYNFMEFGYDPQPLGAASIDVDYDDLQKNASKAGSQQDTILIETRLDDVFGQRLFDELKAVNFVALGTNPTAAEIANFRQQLKTFHYNFKGLTLVPDESSQSVIGLNIFSSFSDITVFYHTVNAKLKGSKSYLFESPSFTHITTDRTSSELAGLVPRQDVATASGNRYIQNGSEVATKIDLSKFYDFAYQDSAKDIIINSAELLIEGIEYPAGITPHASFTLQPVKQENRLYYYLVKADSAVVSKNRVVAPGFGSYFVYPDAPASQFDIVRMSYNSSKKQYSTFLTRFIQLLTRNLRANGELQQADLLYLQLTPTSPAANAGVHRTSFHKDKLKLRIHYTRPTQINPE